MNIEELNKIILLNKFQFTLAYLSYDFTWSVNNKNLSFVRQISVYKGTVKLLSK